jgi:ABC-type dipeptide/oligopeptide/nickel transport system permease component
VLCPSAAGQHSKRARSVTTFHAAEAHCRSSACGRDPQWAHGPSHYDVKETWGPAQQFVFNRILQDSGVIKYSEFVAHSIAAAMSSAALLLISVFLVFGSSGCVLGSFSTPHSAIATLSALGSMALSSIPTFTDAIVQVFFPFILIHCAAGLNVATHACSHSPSSLAWLCRRLIPMLTHTR